MARSKYYLIKEDKKLRVLSFNKKEQTVKIQGDLTIFHTSLEKALNNGYKLVKESL